MLGDEPQQLFRLGVDRSGLCRRDADVPERRRALEHPVFEGEAVRSGRPEGGALRVEMNTGQLAQCRAQRAQGRELMIELEQAERAVRVPEFVSHARAHSETELL